MMKMMKMVKMMKWHCREYYTCRSAPRSLGRPCQCHFFSALIYDAIQWCHVLFGEAENIRKPHFMYGVPPLYGFLPAVFEKSAPFLRPPHSFCVYKHCAGYREHWLWIFCVFSGTRIIAGSGVGNAFYSAPSVIYLNPEPRTAQIFPRLYCNVVNNAVVLQLIYLGIKSVMNLSVAHSPLFFAAR